MMELLKLPELFKGDWRNLLILTYGADLPFFEISIWRQLSKNCRNRIILADSSQYLRACKLYAENGMVKFLNHRYLVEGISIPRSAHAKLILLTSQEKGRLLIGSGNLGLDGYASGGELFTQYEFSKKEPDQLPAFVSAWEFVQELVARGWVGSAAVRYLNHLHEQTPWLVHSSGSDWSAVRHNLAKSFLAQLKEVVEGEPVKELWILSPFYDEKAHALQELIATLAPQKIVLLVQAGQTSLDLEALNKVLDVFPGQCQVHTFRLKEDRSNTYVHAKLYLVKTKHQAICLQGSPNLSQVAMLFTPPTGNIELANISIGSPGDFDYIFENLEIAPQTPNPETLDLALRKTDKEELSGLDWHLTGGANQDGRLILCFQGHIPELAGLMIKIADTTYPILGFKPLNDSVELQLPDEARALLGSPVPVYLVLANGDQVSNPVFVQQLDTLDREMLGTDAEEAEIEGIGDLDFEDEEFERVLGELEASLVFDRRSVWQLAGRTLPKYSEDDDEGLCLDYADIDYEQLRRHPRIIPYLSDHPGMEGQYYSKSRLQMILSAITDYFNGLVKISAGQPVLADVTELIDAGIEETEAEREEEDKEKQKRRKSAKARIRQILKSLVKRYIRGIKSPDFQELAGFQVMARNYVIFSHLLWRLFAKDWVEPEFVIDSFVQIWRFFWGFRDVKGYYSSLEESEQQQILQLFQKQHSAGLLIASGYYGSYLSFIEGWEPVRFSLRDTMRYLLSARPFEFTKESIEDAWIYTSSLFPYNTPIPSKIIQELDRLAHYETQGSFLRSIEMEYGYPEGSCSFEKQSVYREHLRASASVDCLVIDGPNAIATIDVAYSIVRDWEKFHPRDYYRIMAKDSSRIFFYDSLVKKGLYYQREVDEDSDIRKLPILPGKEWEKTIGRIKEYCVAVDEEISLKVRAGIANESDKKSPIPSATH